MNILPRVVEHTPKGKILPKVVNILPRWMKILPRVVEHTPKGS